MIDTTWNVAVSNGSLAFEDAVTPELHRDERRRARQYEHVEAQLLVP